MAPDFLDRYSRGNSVCHRLPARLKIVLTLGVILASLCLPIEQWPLHGCLLCLVFAAQSLAKIPLRYLLRRLTLFLPFVLLLAISIPSAQGFQRGWELFFAVLVRSALSFLAGLWLVNVTPFDELLTALRKFGVPLVLIAILAFMYRYLFVVFDELNRMRDARRARSFGRRSWRRELAERAQLVGVLLIRSLERAERVYGAMCARGWNGQIHTLESRPDR
jgi:cobalt/nickel transport system permease protein